MSEIAAAGLPFEKMQGVGNDFFVIAAWDWPSLDWGRLALQICDRHFGVGADGLLLVDDSNRADFRMRMFNPDGTEDDCGNGLRCVVRFLREHRTRLTSFTVETISGVHQVEVLEHGPSRSVVRAAMGEPRFLPGDIPMLVDRERVINFPLSVGKRTYPATCLNTGSTHCVILLDAEPEVAALRAESPAIEHHPLFPERTSVIWTWQQGPGALRVFIWERGAGETLGCGTGACAAAVAAQVNGLSTGPITVHSAGGALTISWQEGSPIQMTGPAETVFTGRWGKPS